MANNEFKYKIRYKLLLKQIGEQKNNWVKKLINMYKKQIRVEIINSYGK